MCVCMCVCMCCVCVCVLCVVEHTRVGVEFAISYFNESERGGMKYILIKNKIRIRVKELITLKILLLTRIGRVYFDVCCLVPTFHHFVAQRENIARGWMDAPPIVPNIDVDEQFE